MRDTGVGNAALAAELRDVVDHAEALLDALSEHGDEAVSALRDRVYAAVDTARARLIEMENQSNRATQRIALSAENYVYEHPMPAVAISAAVGLALGGLIARFLRGGPDTSGESASVR